MEDVAAIDATSRARAASTSTSRMSAQDVELLQRAVASLTSTDGTSTEGADAVAALARTIEGYREQATLLDPTLSSLIEPLIARVAEACTRRMRGVVIQSSSSSASRDESVKRCCEALNALSSVRGWKTCVRFYPNAAKFLEPSIRYLREIRDESEFWQVRQVVVSWQSILAIVPFDLVTVNSSSEDDKKIVENGVPGVVCEWLCDLRFLLRDPGGIRDVAAITIGKLLSRRDTSTLLRDFVQYAHATLRCGVGARDGELVFLCPGILSALASIFKAGSREVVLEHAATVWGLTKCIADSKLAKDSTLVRQLCIKLGSRVGLVFMKPRVVSWRYDRGRRCLQENLDNRRPTPRSVETRGPDDGDATFEVPETIDDIVEVSLQGLRDCETIVRWTSAKALGRISLRLPRDFADEIVGAVLDCLSVIQSDSTWHGGCLALAELARRGLLLPNRLPEAVPRCMEALTYDVRRGAHSIGAHVRDAAAYVCWAFARAYAPDVFEPFVCQLAPALLTVSCFDREVNCRRAAAAAFQESVGRIGTFPHGIEIVNKADYFSLGSRSRAVLEVSRFICQFEEYRRPMIEYVFDASLTHWEQATRQLAASAIGALGDVDAEWITSVGLRTVIARCSSSDLPTRHGAMIALGEIFVLATRASIEIPTELCDNVVRVIERIEDKHIFRGKGGEIMRSAVCRLFECIASVGQSLTMDSRVWRVLVDVSEDCLKCSSVDVQVAASKALVAFVHDRCSSDDDAFIVRSLLLKHADVLGSEHLAIIRRGSALVLGGFPPRTLCGDPRTTPIEDTDHSVWRVPFEALVRATQPEDDSEMRDAETRVNAAYSLVEMVVSMLSFVHDAREPSSLTVAEINVLSDCAVNALLNCLHDYCVDTRGDVGSWIREAAMKSLPVLVGALQNHDALSSTQAQDIVKNVFKQALEKIDRVRCQAIATLVQLVRGDENLTHSLRITGGSIKLKPLVDLPERELLETVLPSTIDDALDASNASVIFQTLIPVLKSKTYAQFVLSGWFVSGGSGGQRLVRCASEALLDATRTEKSLSRVLAGSIVSNLRMNKRKDRVTVPTMRMFDKLMCRGLLEEKGDDSFDMVELIRYECFSSRDVAKLILGCACLSYYVGHSVQRVSDSAMMGLLALLNNRYPRVRLAAVEQLYLGLSTFSEPSEGVKRVVQVISLSSWDAPPSVTREIRMQIYDLLGLEIPAFLRKSNRKVAKEVRGEETSYAALVNEAGY